MRFRSLLVVVVLHAFLPVCADEADERLRAFFTEVTTLDARFYQEVFDENEQSVQKSSGFVKLSRPGRFRWEYDWPSPQLILADGELLWIYDEELAQATVKPIAEALGAAPIVLLTELRPLQEEFQIKALAEQDGLAWLALLPKVQDTEFTRIEIGMQAQVVRQMALYDQFGQKTVIRFEDLKTGITIPPADFRFDVPEGVDVIGKVD